MFAFAGNCIAFACLMQKESCHEAFGRAIKARAGAELHCKLESMLSVKQCICGRTPWSSNGSSSLNTSALRPDCSRGMIWGCSSGTWRHSSKSSKLTCRSSSRLTAIAVDVFVESSEWPPRCRCSSRKCNFCSSTTSL